RFPESCMPAQRFGRFLSHIRLPALHQLRHRCLPDVYQHVHMVRHHHPSEQPITNVCKMSEGLLYGASNTRVAQVTLATAAIQVLLQLLAFLAAVLDRQQVLPLMPFAGGHRIPQPERYDLDEAFIITVGDVTALMPPDTP